MTMNEAVSAGGRAAKDGHATQGRATKVGRVVSDKMQKTIVVEVERRVQHAQYTRTIKRTSRFHAHDEAGAAKVGDRVRIEETRPMSKLKRWRLREILVKAEA
jgi:small subunit ribosomal protein S17